MATAHVDKDSESWILGLSKEVYDISEFLVLFEKSAQKCRNSNKKIAAVRVLFGGSVSHYYCTFQLDDDNNFVFWYQNSIL